MRTLTPAMIAALTGQETGEVVVILLTIDHDDLAEPLRFSSDPTERHSDTPLVYKTVSRGDDYYYIPTDIALPSDTQDEPPGASIRLSNVGREVIELIRSTTTPAEVTMEICLASDPDTVVTFPVFDLVGASYDADQIMLRLAVDALATEPYPARSFDPGSFPALF